MKNPHATRTSVDYAKAFTKFKEELARTPLPPKREFRPLKVAPHPRQREMQAYAAIPSRWH